MEPSEAQELANNLIGSAHLLVAAILNMKKAVLSETAGKSVTFTQLKVLKLIDIVGPQQVSDVAAFLGVSDAAASKTVDNLVRQKCLRRDVGETDRRRSLLSLAARGRKVVAQYDISKDHVLGAIFRDFNRNDVLRITEFLERLTKAIVNGSANPEEICLQCGIYLKQRCLVHEAAREQCQYQRRRRARALIPVAPAP